MRQFKGNYGKRNPGYNDLWFDTQCHDSRYGFRSPPHLELKARPKLGEREVTFAHVTDWIEKKLDQEFQVRSGVLSCFKFRLEYN